MGDKRCNSLNVLRFGRSCFIFFVCWGVLKSSEFALKLTRSITCCKRWLSFKSESSSNTLLTNAFWFNVLVQWCMVAVGRIFYEKRLSKIFSAGGFVNIGWDKRIQCWTQRNESTRRLSCFLKQQEIAMPAVYSLIEAEINRMITWTSLLVFSCYHGVTDLQQEPYKVSTDLVVIKHVFPYTK